jgi:hypothetical protein
VPERWWFPGGVVVFGLAAGRGIKGWWEYGVVDSRREPGDVP